MAGVTLSGRHNFNYLLPAGAVRFLSIVRTAGRWGDRVVSHDATFRLLASMRVRFWERLAPLPAAGEIAGTNGSGVTWIVWPAGRGAAT